MKVDFLKELGLSDEQISKIQAESGKDVQKEKDKATAIQTKLDEANEQIKALNETIKGSEGDAQKLKDLQEKVQGYEKAEADRKKAEEEATKEAGIRARFDGLKGENKYLNEGTETWILNEFKKALESKDNAGKSDADIYAAVIKDKNVFAGKQKLTIPPANGNSSGEVDGITKAFLERNPGIKI
jgi:DNA repair exonuclease SbcCD ATPase subunit